MTLFRVLLAITLSGTSLASVACTPFEPSVSYAQQASFAAVGHAVSNRWVSSRGELRVSVAVDKVLVGHAPGRSEGVSPCAFPIKEGARVVVARIRGELVVYPADMYERSFRQAFGKDH
jgi:hypothetical protein